MGAETDQNTMPSSITRKGFQSTFETGIDLEDSDLASSLGADGVSLAELKEADLDGDGVISGRGELNRAFNVVDSVDSDGKANSFLNAGEAASVYGALLDARRPPPYFGAAIAKAAADRVASDGPGYAFDSSPTSPLVGLSGNVKPGITRPAWLEQNNKCNAFCGDVLTQASVVAPTVTMPDGSLHYARAETWPNYKDLFTQVTNQSDIKVGDVIMRDNTASRGASTAHIEIITGVAPMKTTGAHATGADERSEDWLAGATFNPTTGTWVRGDDEIYVLRPKKPLAE
jgi:hypothetical protein